MANAKTWAKRVATWRASGESAAAFAAGRGFAPSTLRWWASQLGREDAALVRVVRTGEPAMVSRREAIELEIDGVRIHVRAGFDRGALVEILDALRGRGHS